MAYIELTDDQWYAEYEPTGKMYETYGEEMNYINEMPDNLVWTLVDGDEDSVVVNGRAYVNRLAYYVTKKPHNPEDTIVVNFEVLD